MTQPSVAVNYCMPSDCTVLTSNQPDFCSKMAWFVCGMSFKKNFKNLHIESTTFETYMNCTHCN